MNVHLFSRQVATYFWFLGDLFIVCLFAISFTTAYRYIHQRRKLESHGVYSELQIQHRLRRSIYKHVMCKSFAIEKLVLHFNPIVNPTSLCQIQPSERCRICNSTKCANNIS